MRAGRLVRRGLRARHGRGDAAANQDARSLYKKALAGEIAGFTGVDDPCRRPSVRLVVDTMVETPEESLRRVPGHLVALGRLEHADRLVEGDRVHSRADRSPGHRLGSRRRRSTGAWPMSPAGWTHSPVRSPSRRPTRTTCCRSSGMTTRARSRRNGRAMGALVAAAGSERTRARPAEREWSVVGCLGHAVDAEVVSGAIPMDPRPRGAAADRLRPGPVGRPAPRRRGRSGRAPRRCSGRSGSRTSRCGAILRGRSRPRRDHAERGPESFELLFRMMRRARPVPPGAGASRLDAVTAG